MRKMRREDFAVFRENPRLSLDTGVRVLDLTEAARGYVSVAPITQAIQNQGPLPDRLKVLPGLTLNRSGTSKKNV
jgi:hypothetical protein